MRTRLTLSLMLLTATAAGGDRLPLAGGGWIETRGAWRLEGRQVIFRTAEGRLAALPATEVDLARLRPRPLPAGKGDSPALPADRPVSPYPDARPLAMPDPSPLPPQRPPRRPASDPLPAGCRLANAEPGETPQFHCPPPPAGAPPAGRGVPMPGISPPRSGSPPTRAD